MTFGITARLHLNRAAISLPIVLCLLVPATARAQRPGALRVLFIGNSYTYFNDLPEVFAKLAEAGHQGKIETRMVAPGGWRLKDHWEKGTARKLLGEGKWDFVVLQDQSTLGMDYWVEGTDHANSDAIFRPYAEKWAAQIQANGAAPVFFLTWAGKNVPEDQPALNYAYVRAAKDTRSLLAPVGMAWDALRHAQPSLALFYEGHGSHPSPAGSYLAACVLYATILHRDPLGLPSRITGTPVNLDTEKLEPGKSVTLVDLSAIDAETIQREAWKAWQGIADHGGYPNVLRPNPPAVEPLPAGLPLSGAELDGTWLGTILFYPIGPVEIVLRIESSPSLRGQLEIRYHSKDFADESVELSDLRVQGSELSFSDPKSVGVDNLAVHLLGVMPRHGELRGTAEASRENADSHVRLLGTWSLRKQ
jgi:hypothetical protein